MATSDRQTLAGLDESRSVDALFVNAPLRDYNLRPRINDFTLPVLGMAYVATYAKQNGFNVGVLDAESLGLGLDETAKIVNRASPRWAGFNLLAPTYEMSARIAALLDPKIDIVLGGHHAKAMPERILRDARFGNVAALVVGEGETRVLELLKDRASRAALPGVVWRDTTTHFSRTGVWQGSPQEFLAPEIDRLPFVERGFLVDDPHVDAEGRVRANMIATRGCPYNCSFCGAAVSANPDITIRARSPENVVAEMESLSARLNVSSFRFVDDLFLGTAALIAKYLAVFDRAAIGERFVWDATGRINILNRMSDGDLQRLRRAGCRELALGIESGSRRVLEYMGKHITPEMTRSVVRRAARAGISIKGYFILGYPTETADELRDTVTLVRDLWELAPVGFRASVFEFRPYPGTPEWRRLVAAGHSEDRLLEYCAVDLSELGLEEGLRGRDEFNFSVNIQFGEVAIEDVRAALVTLSREQATRNPARS